MSRYLSLRPNEVRLLAKVLNEARLSIFGPTDRAALPDLARKLAGFLLDGDNSTAPPYVKKRKPPKPPNKLIGFELTRAPGSEWQQTRAALGDPFAAAAAKAPIE